jgi:GNAT superfamily N-acetyltransferase
MEDWRAQVDRWWADVLSMPVAAMRAGGVFASSHFDHVGVIAVQGGSTAVVYGPPQMLPALNAAARACDGNPLESDVFLNALAPRVRRLLGPAWYGYATAQSLRPSAGHGVRPLSEPDLPLLAALHGRTPAAEREDSGTTGLPAFGYVDQGDLQAVACLGMWHGMPTIGVLTDPKARGRGLAGMVVTEAVREGLNRRAVVQYRAWRRNTASIAVALRCGFTHYCDSLVVDLVP